MSSELRLAVPWDTAGWSPVPVPVTWPFMPFRVGCLPTCPQESWGCREGHELPFLSLIGLLSPEEHRVFRKAARRLRPGSVRLLSDTPSDR